MQELVPLRGEKKFQAMLTKQGVFPPGVELLKVILIQEVVTNPVFIDNCDCTKQYMTAINNY